MSVMRSLRSKARRSFRAIPDAPAADAKSSTRTRAASPLTPRDWHGKAAQFCKSKRWEEALEIMLKLVEQYPDNISLHTETAYIYHKGLSLFDKAEEYYSHAVDLCEAPAIKKKGGVTPSRDSSSALSGSTTRDSATDSDTTPSVEGSAKKRKKRRKKRRQKKGGAPTAAAPATINMADILHKDLYFLTLSNYLCLLAENVGKLPEAMQVLTKLVKTKSEPSAEEWSYYAHVLCYIGDFDQSLRVFDKSLELDHNNPTTHYRRARMLLIWSRIEEALQSINKCIRIVQTTSHVVAELKQPRSSDGYRSDSKLLKSKSKKRFKSKSKAKGGGGGRSPLLPRTRSRSQESPLLKATASKHDAIDISSRDALLAEVRESGKGPSARSAMPIITSSTVVSPSVSGSSDHCVFAAHFGEAFDISVSGGDLAIYGLYFWLKGEVLYESGEYSESTKFFKKSQLCVHGVDPYVNTLAHCGNLRIALITGDMEAFEKVYTEFEKGGHIDMSLDWYILAMKAWYMSLKLRNSLAAEATKAKAHGGMDAMMASMAVAKRRKRRRRDADGTATSILSEETIEDPMPATAARGEELEKISLTFERALEIALSKCEVLNFKFVHGVHTVLYFYAMHSHYTERDLDKALDLYNRILTYYRPHWAKIHLQIAAVHVLRAYSLNPTLKQIQRAYDHFSDATSADD